MVLGRSLAKNGRKSVEHVFRDAVESGQVQRVACAMHMLPFEMKPMKSHEFVASSQPVTFMSWNGRFSQAWPKRFGRQL